MALINFNEYGKKSCNSLKKLAFIMLSTLLLISCNTKTPEQQAKEEYEAEKQAAMRHEIYIDSIVNIACGVGKYEYMRTNRLNAIEILKKEYPSMNHKWDSIANKIRISESE